MNYFFSNWMSPTAILKVVAEFGEWEQKIRKNPTKLFNFFFFLETKLFNFGLVECLVKIVWSAYNCSFLFLCLHNNLKYKIAKIFTNTFFKLNCLATNIFEHFERKILANLQKVRTKRTFIGAKTSWWIICSCIEEIFIGLINFLNFCEN